MTYAFFTADPDDPQVLHPTPMATSQWSPEDIHGVAAGGAMARAIEQALAAMGRTELQAARFTVDLFRPAKKVATRVRTRVLRESSRLVLIDAELMHGEGDAEQVTSRSSATFLLPTESPSGLVWSSEDVPQVPPLDEVPPTTTPRPPFMRSDTGWSQNLAGHANPGRKMMWQSIPPLVGGEEQSWFVSAAAVADATSMVVNWGSHGVEFINTDITIALSRPFIGREIGLEARDRFEHDGIAVGSSVLIDRTGPVGISLVTAMANTRRTVTFAGAKYHDAP